ncbi:probable methyltransferase TARBP1 isoform X2 [Scyliorhinus canicula]|uniref:probable methyltransferase TARBP1 isoform X2 n=1 Tax=Scyliorhinus canicula TaxID=7830 RepID=UPI0018F70BCE|nr:probable methyltransferase TARBP1 isoform X2 [Scyliorhinus canicula]
MEPLLVADLLLRLGHGPPSTTLRELCRWCREGENRGPPDAGRVEMLRLLVEKLSPSGQPGDAGASQADRTSCLRDLAVGWCLPLLRGLRLEGPGGQFQEPGRRLVHSLCALLHACCRQAPPALLQDIAGAPLRDLRRYIEERGRVASAEGEEEPQSLELSDIQVAIEVLVKLAPLLLEGGIGVEELLSLTLTAVKVGEDSVASRMVTGLIPALLPNPGSSLHKYPTVEDIWDRVKRWERTGTVSRVLLLLSSLPHHLLICTGDQSPSETLDLRTSAEFWEVVQRGLVQPDNTSRKRAMYLLKRAVDASNTLQSEICSEYKAESDTCLFWWSGEKGKQLIQLWENYILIMETLEENQVHVIRPIFPRLKSLMDATVCNDQGRAPFHTSWLLCAYKRMFESENKTAMKEGLFQFLDLGVMKYPFRTRELCEFICGPVMDAISESTFYSRSPDQVIGSCPVLAVKLQTFFVDLVENVAEEFKGDFLMKLIKSMAAKHWCAVPILFISQALVHIPSRKTWGVEGLHALREVIRCTMTNHQVLLRGAAQCYLLQTAMHLTNVEKVTLSDISNFLASIRTEEALSRGTKLWMELCKWLHSNDRNFRNEEDATEVCLKRSALSVYILNLVEQYLKVPATEGENASFMPDWFEAQLVARMILLAADIEEQYSTEGVFDSGDQKSLSAFLHPLTDVLWKLNTHAYLPVLKADKSLQLLLKLLETSSSKQCTKKPEDRVLNALRECVMSSVEQVLEYTLRRLTSELQTVLDLDRCRLYLAVMNEIVKTLSTEGRMRGSCIWSYISSLSQVSIRYLQAPNDNGVLKLGQQIQMVVARASLAWVCKITAQYPELELDSLEAVKTLVRSVLIGPFNQNLEKPFCSTQDNGLLEDGSSAQGWGKISAQYVHDQWACIYFILNKFEQSSESAAFKSCELSLPVVENPALILGACIEALNIVPSDRVLPILQCMKILVPKLYRSEESLCVKSLDLAWKTVLELNSNQLHFWPTFSAYIKIAFHHQLLSITGECAIGIKVKEATNKLLEMSQTKTGVFNVLITHCCHTWLPTVSAAKDFLPDSFASAENHVDLFVEACLFGPVFRKDQRLIQDVHIHIELLGDECAANGATEYENRDDQSVRIWAINFLCQLNGSNLLHKKFIENVVSKLLEKDEELRNSKGRYYVNSMLHRLKNRIWQTLLVLLPQMDQVFLSSIIETVYQSGLSDNQASVKYLIEWFIILILQKCPEFIDSFWRCFSYNPESTKTSICTFLAVLVHINVILRSVSKQDQYLKKALSVILPWCLNHNFSVRLYALLALQQVWEACLVSKLEGKELQFLAPIIESCLEQVGHKQITGNAGKNWQRIQDHFFFGKFQPLEDYSLETIFYIFPSLSDVIEDEWIPAWKFNRVMDLLPSSSSINVFNPRNQICDVKLTDWIQRDKGYGLAEVDQDNEWTDVQKKIMPWKNNIPDQDLELICQERTTMFGKSSNSSLIIVASLIDKPTNLGGLCRTSEIFGASALVVNNVHCVDDKQFQALSVSAEQWLPVIEVRPAQLVEYLQRKKTEGYTIIGVEQTANSHNLAHYSFPEKTLLLLGNEREGIPANFIQYLDVCVEIPQCGIIRSLNVHVSGALLMWEYTRQQMMKQAVRPETETAQK